MAALGENLLSGFLLNEEVSNSYTLSEFKEFFPRKYRDHQDVKVLYDAYQTKRKLIRDRVVMNVRLHCRKRRHKDETLPDNKYEDDIKALEAKEEILQEEIDAMQKDIEQVQQKIISCTDNLEKKNCFSGLQTADLKTSKHKRTRPTLTD